MSPLTLILSCGVVAMGYCLGSIPTGIIVSRFLGGGDIRHLGSGNVGATNVRRVFGNIPGTIVLAGDLFKGFLPVLLSTRMQPFTGTGFIMELVVSLTVLGAFAGHLYPVYFRGRFGGKGVATAAGCFFAVSPMATVGALLVFILMVWRCRMVSLGSLSAVAVLPVFLWISVRSPWLTVVSVVVAVFIFIRHTDNIRRMHAGTEPKI